MKKVKKVILIILEFAFIALAIYSAYNIYIWYTENQKTSRVLKEITKSVTIDENNRSSIDFAELKKQNSDVAAYLNLNGTDIQYPVVQAKDNQYYLNHSFDKSESGAGWIFLDYRNKLDKTDKNLIIYGHNRRDGSMFGTLKNILNKEWYENKDNTHITLNLENEDLEYEVFSVYQIPEEDYYINTNFSDESFIEFTQELKKRSIYDFGVELSSNDSILTLSSCANNNKYRIVLHAKQI